MTPIQITGDALWSRVERAVEKVKDRLRRVASALDAAGIPYAIIGGNAVQVWVAQVDETAVRNTRDVDILLRREDLVAATSALAATGFVYRHAASIDMFLDGPDASARDAVHVVFAGEKVRDDHLLVAPDVDEFSQVHDFRMLTLAALVRMKLNAFRDKDRMHLRDMLEVGLIDASWLATLPSELAGRLQLLLDNPDG